MGSTQTHTGAVEELGMQCGPGVGVVLAARSVSGERAGGFGQAQRILEPRSPLSG
ncbi:MAG: hypothetical protein WBG76_09955 [Ornithinimicrobium sp.]